jgi:thymidylate synthase
VEYPLIDNIVTLPEGSTLPAPTSAEKSEEYFHRYILGHELAENETYTYGQRLNISLWGIIEMLKDTPVTNQAVCEIARPEDWNSCKGKDGKDDPPCLRKIQFMVVPKYKKVECDCEARPSQTLDGKCPGCGDSGFIYVLDRENSILNIYTTWRSWDLYNGMPENLAGISKLLKFVSDEIGIPAGHLYAFSPGLHLYKYQKEIAELRTKLTAPEF